MPLQGLTSDGYCTCGKRDCTSQAKHPKWHRDLLPAGLKGASSDEKVIKQWWKLWPNANIGIVTGKQSRIYVLDVDVKDDGDKTLAALMEQYGGLPDTLHAHTGGGGSHWIFEYPKGYDIGNTSGKLGKGLDTRGEGGYIVAAPSVHVSGGSYVWAVDDWEDIDPLPMPGWLMTKIIESDTSRRKEVAGRVPGTGPMGAVAKGDSSMADVLLDGALQRCKAEGGRNDVGFWLACQLRDNGFSQIEAAKVMTEYVDNTPDKDTPYTVGEAEASLNQAYRQSPREPWKKPGSRREEPPGGGDPDDEEGEWIPFRVAKHGIGYEDPKDGNRKVTDFTVDIRSIVHDDQRGRLYYCKIHEFSRGRHQVSDTIEIRPEALDTKSKFYEMIRHVSHGEIIDTRANPISPLKIFKWLYEKHDKPVVRRPEHMGLVKGKDGRPYWMFGNALVCPPWTEQPGKIVTPSEDGAYEVDEHTGFILPLFVSEGEREKMVPIINTGLENVEEFMYQVKDNLVKLMGGGDARGEATNMAKLLLGYIIYHLYEDDLYNVNDLNGHTVMFYIYGEKGSGKSTYFGTLLRAFFGLHKTKDIKGNRVTVPALENALGMYASMPVPYDEYNYKESPIDYQAINGYYHRSSRSVSDVDRAGRNKFSAIRGMLSIISNFPIDSDVDQADATESRTIYLHYKKEYRSRDMKHFQYFEDQIDRLSSLTAHWLLTQTGDKRKRVKASAMELYTQFKDRLDAIVEDDRDHYTAEHRLTDNYTRLLACYELVFGRDVDLRKFVGEELKRRFAVNKTTTLDHKMINQLVYLAAEGLIRHVQHYFYSDSDKMLYINVNLIFNTYEHAKRDRSVSKKEYKQVMDQLFESSGFFAGTATKRWYGSYFTHQGKISVNAPKHSHMITYEGVMKIPLFKELFPPPEEVTGLQPDNQEDLGLDGDETSPF